VIGPLLQSRSEDVSISTQEYEPRGQTAGEHVAGTAASAPNRRLRHVVSVGRADYDGAHPFKPRLPHDVGKRLPAAHALAIFRRMQVIRIVEAPADVSAKARPTVVLPVPATPMITMIIANVWLNRMMQPSVFSQARSRCQ
jgi:hypothetical protein